MLLGSPATGEGGLGGARTRGRKERPEAPERGGHGQVAQQVRSRAGLTGCSSHPSLHLWSGFWQKCETSGACLWGGHAV